MVKKGFDPKAKAEKNTPAGRMTEKRRLLDDIRRSIDELMETPGSRLDTAQKSLREDMRRHLENLADDQVDEESFSRYMADALKFMSNELAWYKAVLNNLPFPTSVFDLDHRWTYLNPPAARAMGGGPVTRYLGLTYNEGWKEYKDSSELDDGEDLKIYRFTRHLKYPRQVFSGHRAVLEDSQGQEIGLIETLNDITKTQEAEERTRLMLDATPLACCFFNHDGAIVDCNLEAAALSGCKTKKHYLEHFFELLPPYLPDGQVTSLALLRHIRQAFNEGRAFMPEMVLRTLDGTDVTGEALFIRVEWREAHTVLGYFRDLRSLKAAQEKLERERLLLNDILNGCPVPFAIVKDGVIKFSTPMSKAELGLEPGGTLDRLSLDRRDLSELRQDLAEKGDVNWRPIRARKTDGTISENLLKAYLAEFENNPAAMVWMMDVTELRRNERELSEARDMALASTRAKSEFLANISHEILTPMNAIIGFTKLLRETELNSHQYDFVAKTDAAAKSLLHLINGILDFSRLESGKLKLTLQDFHLQDVLKNIVDLTTEQARQKGLEFIVQVAPNTPVGLVGDEYRLLQCLNNLLDNAVKFTEQGEITLTVDPVKETPDEITLRFLICDTGIGIENQHLDKLFEPFIQADNSATRRYGGTGLGLAISKKLANLMNGEIWCQSAPGRGSSFGFTARFGRHNHAELFINRRRDFHGLSALIVDDNIMFQTVSGQYLKAFGFEASAASSGEDALDTVNRLRAEGRFPDLVIVGLKMSGWDGLETARRLNGAVPPGEPLPKIILTTTHSRAQVSRAAAATGIKAVLEKPILAETLENVLGILFETGGAAPSGRATLSESEQKRKLTRAAKGRDVPSPAKHLTGARILLVEDNEVNQMVAKKILLKAGLEVSVANNGQEALEMVKAGYSFDLILMDIQMPVMDGLTAAREIRRLDNGVDLPIVALTAHSQPEDREKSFSAGMNDHLTKPLDINGLFHCLDKFIKTGPNGHLA